ncbi:MAG: hypothetical protein K2I63_03255, partial [Helicobacter sp.]|nr:hypothetical protein [Helicobacter sp.]
FKTMEYASNGVIPLINDLPEYLRLFSHKNAYFTQNSKDSIIQTIQAILNAKKDEVIRKKQTVFEVAKEKMDYKKITKDFYEFLQTLYYKNL